MANRQISKTLIAFPPEVRSTLLRALLSDSEARAKLIQQLYMEPDGRRLAEMLMDLEADRRVKADVMEALNESLM